MKTRIKVTFSDGEISVIEFRLRNRARMELVIRAWALLWQRDVLDWKRTTAPADVFYHGRSKQVRRCDDEEYRNELADMIPIAVAMQERQREIVELRKKGLGVREIARELKMPVASVSKFVKNSAVKLPPLSLT